MNAEQAIFAIEVALETVVNRAYSRLDLPLQSTMIPVDVLNHKISHLQAAVNLRETWRARNKESCTDFCAFLRRYQDFTDQPFYYGLSLISDQSLIIACYGE